MILAEILKPVAVEVEVPGGSPKLLFERFGRLLEPEAGVDEAEISAALMAREQQGSTAVGHGVAIPHAEVRGLQKPLAAVLRLQNPVDWHAFDRLPVDLVVALIGPVGDHEHLKRLAEVSRLLRTRAMREKLRGAPEAEGLYALMTGMAELA